MKNLLLLLSLFGFLSINSAAQGPDVGDSLAELLTKAPAALSVEEVGRLQIAVRSLREELATLRGESPVEDAPVIAVTTSRGPCPLASLAQLAGKPIDCDGHLNEAPVLVAVVEPTAPPALKVIHDHGSCALSKLAALAGEPECDAGFNAAPIFASFEPDIEEVVEEVLEEVAEEVLEESAPVSPAAWPVFFQKELSTEEDAEPIACTLGAPEPITACAAAPVAPALPATLTSARIELAVVRAQIAKAKRELAQVQAELAALEAPRRVEAVEVVALAVAEPAVPEEGCCSSEPEPVVAASCSATQPIPVSIQLAVAPKRPCSPEAQTASAGDHKLRVVHEDLVAARAELAGVTTRLAALKADLARRGSPVVGIAMKVSPETFLEHP